MHIFYALCTSQRRIAPVRSLHLMPEAMDVASRDNTTLDTTVAYPVVVVSKGSENPATLFFSIFMISFFNFQKYIYMIIVLHTSLYIWLYFCSIYNFKVSIYVCIYSHTPIRNYFPTHVHLYLNKNKHTYLHLYCDLL